MTQIASIDFLGTLLAALLTIMILSYLFGDNPLYRIATSIFIGVAAGYAGTAAWYFVLQPSLVNPLLLLLRGETGVQGGSWIIQVVLTVVPLVLTFMLIFKGSLQFGRVGNIPLALMTGVGAAVVIGGALLGTLIPQVRESIVNLNPEYVNPITGERGLERLVNALIMLVGTVSTLLYFQFTVNRKNALTGERSPVVQVISQVGSGFIAITFGVIYAGLLLASIVVLAERVRFLIDVAFQFFLV